jgi:phosphomannomutase
MPVISSVSGIRGTIGGLEGDNLSPPDIVKFTTAYAYWLKEQFENKTRVEIVLGRDARISGSFLSQIVCGTLNACGVHVINLGLSTTPTVELAVRYYKASGGIILTASHNPIEWNALKLLNSKGEFLSVEAGRRILELKSLDSFSYSDVFSLGFTREEGSFIQEHVDLILAHPLVDSEAIRSAGFSIAIDAVNSTGGIAVPMLLDALGVKGYMNAYGEPTGKFPHPPEPLPENLTDFFSMVKENGCDLGIVVDPDVDRLAFVCEDGSFFGEEYTLAAVADYVLQCTPGPVVSNMSSSAVLEDVALKYGQKRFVSPVGEVHVVSEMRACGAVIGGEGNGGIIVPDLHYGRDALIGIALFLTHLAKWGGKMSDLRKTYPNYTMHKLKVDLAVGTDTEAVLRGVRGYYATYEIDLRDGVWIKQPGGWLHLRRSNTEPIIRIYSENRDSEVSYSEAMKAKGYILEEIKKMNG